MSDNLPIFKINNRFQKSQLTYRQLLDDNLLVSICQQLTGCSEFEVQFRDELNIGRMATLEHNGHIHFISFSEQKAEGRNSFFQSVVSAIVRFILEDNPHKSMHFYFLPLEGNYETDYFWFMYRLMASAGVHFLNQREMLSRPVMPFTTIEDIMAARQVNQRNQNSSTYITRNEQNQIEIYGKTYGASKKETTLLCLALSAVTAEAITLYQIKEGDLSELPELDKRAIEALNRITIIVTDITMEEREFDSGDSLRSPTFLYNLLSLRGPKKCSLCDCSIAQLIEGAHIWPVAAIRKEALSQEAKLQHATNGENGLWLCKNHHKMLDGNIIKILPSGEIATSHRLAGADKTFIEDSIKIPQLPATILSGEFLQYLDKRYR